MSILEKLVKKIKEFESHLASLGQYVGVRFSMFQKAFTIDMEEHSNRLAAIEEKLGITPVLKSVDDKAKEIQEFLKGTMGLVEVEEQKKAEEVKPVELVDKKREHIEF